MLTILSSTIISSSFCLGTNDFSEWSAFSEVAEPDEFSETDEAWLMTPEGEADAIPDDDTSWAVNFWYLCETIENHSHMSTYTHTHIDTTCLTL